MPVRIVMDWMLLLPTLMGILGALWPRVGTRAAGTVLMAGAALSASLGVQLGLWSLAFTTLVLILSAAAFLMSPEAVAHAVGHANAHPRAHRAYYLLLGLFGSTLLALAQPWPLLYLWVAVEATTLTSVALVALPMGSRPFEAAWKYLMLAGMGGLVALGGIVLLDAGTVGAAVAGTALMLVGFGAKAGLVPFHTWLPDAHSQAPAPVSAMLSGAELAGIMWVLHQALGVAGQRIGHPGWPGEALVALGIVSMLLGIGSMSAQGNVKRFLAYSSIEHMGVIAIGFGIGGIALFGALLHVITHGLSKAQCFFAAGTIQSRYGSVEGSELGALHQNVPWASGGLATGLAALAGLPPFGPFWSEWLIVGGGLAQASTRLIGGVLAALLVLGFLAIAYRAPRWWAPRGARLQPQAQREDFAEAVTPFALGLLGATAGIVVPIALHWPVLLHG